MSFCSRSIARRWSIFLTAWCRDPACAEELAQEAFLRVYRARKEYSPSAKFTTWLFRIATNLALNAIRDGKYRQMQISMDARGETDEPQLEVAARGLGADEQLIARERKQMIRGAILHLPAKQRAAVVLHKYQEMEYAEIGKVLGCSEGALKSLLFRAYETLRVELALLVKPQVPSRGEGKRT